ncbi:MAG: TonB family protein, partial [Gammaproteobacteria bacterium]|nr:TonB family protein [Gammaproteobacteria bacterium]
QPEPPIPEVNKPEPQQPEPPIPEVNKPEPKQPEPPVPEVNKPKPKQPEPPIPEVHKPESKQSEPVSEESLQRAMMPPASIPAQVSDDLKKEYLRSLMTHIEAHKYYPRRARNRDIEGVVEISFDLLENGDVTNIRTSGGHRLLRAAAEHAIQQSLPLQIPPPFLQLPREIHFSMRFDLD